MAIRADSYSSVNEVRAYVRHMLDGENTFDESTRPTLTDVEKFIDRASAALNVALNTVGLTTPVTNSTAKLLLDDWVTDRAAAFVELTHRGAGFNDGENSRQQVFLNLAGNAAEFVQANRLGMVRLGVGVGSALSDGLQFTGADALSQRDDPEDTNLRQPVFKRGLFSDPEGSGYVATGDGESEEVD